MDVRQESGGHRDYSAALSAARKIAGQLRGLGADGAMLDVTISGGGPGSGGSGVSACTFVIKGDTVDDAYKHAAELESQGCVCTSSGETEVTCVCDGL